jgi:hypothetical protein
MRIHANRLIAVACVTATLLAFEACAAREPRPVALPGSPVDIDALWQDPADITTRDLLHGPGGKALAPDPATAHSFVRTDTTGYSPGYDVRGPDGTLWSVKLGPEAQPEVVSSRLLWAVGYHQPAVYYLPRWTLTGREAGPKGEARFRRDPAEHEVVGDWSWYANPFVGQRPFNGLLVANLLLNNWDWKDSNNKIVQRRDSSEPRRVYLVRDLGASLGKTTFSSWFRKLALRGFAQGTRNDLEGYESQRLIRRVEGNRVVFDYNGKYGRLVEMLTVADVVWTSRLFAQLSDEQLHDAFRAAGYSDHERARYVAKVKAKIVEGLALAR